VGPLERKLNWVCAARNHRSLVSLSLACGLSRTTLFNAVNRERAGRLVQLEARTAEKIAQSQRLPLEWILHGDPDAPPSETYGPSGFTSGAISVVPNTSRVFARRPGQSSLALGEAVDMGLLRSVVDTLVTHDGLSKDEASSLVGNVLFTDEAWGTSSLDLYRAARARLVARGRSAAGAFGVTASLAEGGRGG
jgi:hypothetical protein